MRKRYSSDPAGSEWQLIKPLFNWQRRRKYDLRRDIIDAMFSLIKTGCQAKGYPPHPINSSCAARDTGVEAAAGSILAFTDADCVPQVDWLRQGVKPFKEP